MRVIVTVMLWALLALQGAVAEVRGCGHCGVSCPDAALCATAVCAPCSMPAATSAPRRTAVSPGHAAPPAFGTPRLRDVVIDIWRPPRGTGPALFSFNPVSKESE